VMNDDDDNNKAGKQRRRRRQMNDDNNNIGKQITGQLLGISCCCNQRGVKCCNLWVLLGL